MKDNSNMTINRLKWLHTIYHFVEYTGLFITLCSLLLAWLLSYTWVDISIILSGVIIGLAMASAELIYVSKHLDAFAQKNYDKFQQNPKHHKLLDIKQFFIGVAMAAGSIYSISCLVSQMAGGTSFSLFNLSPVEWIGICITLIVFGVLNTFIGSYPSIFDWVIEANKQIEANSGQPTQAPSNEFKGNAVLQIGESLNDQPNNNTTDEPLGDEVSVLGGLHS